ncbi:MAG TPA: rubredoxin, partial [Puia sp.]|nr:rubredoxin [Puia sp.]
TVLYRQDLEKENLYPYLVSLCKEFYQRQSERHPGLPELTSAAARSSAEPEGYHCLHCLTVYNKEYGDPARGIAPGTPFEALPVHWTCPVCEAPKSDYQLSHFQRLA